MLRRLPLTLCLISQLFAQDLAARYKKLSCAVVKILYDGGSGTGFFVDPKGSIATVAHVVYDRKFKLVGREVQAEVSPKSNLRIQYSNGIVVAISLDATAKDSARKALFDLAVIESKIASPCFIPIGDSDSLKVGQHLISIGFPSSAAAGVLYEGFLSSRHARLAYAVGPIENKSGLQYTPTYDVLRVQMPITPGASGSPVISDADVVVGIVSEIPVVITREVAKIAAAFGGGHATSSGLALSGFDVTAILGQLAWIVSEFESPGAGLAVPVSYLKAPNHLRLPSNLRLPGASVRPK